MEDTLNQLIDLSRHLGQPELDYAILGEGNTSARADRHSFWVKASGQELRTIGPEGFVCVAFDPVLDLLKYPSLSDEATKQGLVAAKVAPTTPGHPSVETVLHALCLSVEGVSIVAHTHPTAINALTCSAAFPDCFGGRLFPDEVVVCGPAPLLVPYVDPGVPLARKVRDLLGIHADRYGEPPKAILMQNHGLIALGRTAQQVANITAMANKAARVLLGTFAAGGPHYLTPAAVQRINTRPDELYRRHKL